MRLRLASLVLALAPGIVQAQATGLDAIEARIREGRIAEARAELERWWQTGRLDASPAETERSLWLRARLTVDPGLAELDYQRMVLEFPNGPLASGARLRLAASADAHGDWATAREHYEAIVRYHSTSPEGPVARAWMRRHAERATLDRPARGADPASGSNSGRTVYTLQLGAFEGPERAQALVQRAQGAGLAPRIVRLEGDDLGLLRVRIGRFASPEAAGATRDRIQGLGFVVTIVPDGGREVRVPSGSNSAARTKGRA